MPPKLAFIDTNIINRNVAAATSGNVVAIATLLDWKTKGQIPGQLLNTVNQALTAGARNAPRAAAPKAPPPPAAYVPTSNLAQQIQTRPKMTTGATQTFNDRVDQLATRTSPNISLNIHDEHGQIRLVHPHSGLANITNPGALAARIETDPKLAPMGIGLAEQTESNRGQLAAQLESRHQELPSQLATRTSPNISLNTTDINGNKVLPFNQKPFKRIPVSGGANTKQKSATPEGSKYTPYPVSGTKPSQKPLEPEVSGVKARGEAGPSKSGENFLIPVVRPFARRRIDQDKIFFIPFKDYRESLSKKSEVDTLFEQMNKNKWGLAKGGPVKQKEEEMNPALMSYLQEIQAKSQQQQQEGDYDPYGAGSAKALQMAEQSRSMTPTQDNRAMGAAIRRFFQGMNRPTGIEGGTGTLAAISNSMGPALDEYDQQQSQAEEYNRQMLAQQEQARAAQEHAMMQARQQQEAMAYKQQQAEQMAAHREAQLEEAKRYHDQQMAMRMMATRDHSAREHEKHTSDQHAKKYSAPVMNKLTKEYNQLKAAEREYGNYLEAERLLKEKGDEALYNPLVTGILSPFAKKRPEGLQNKNQALLENLEANIRGEANKRFGFTNKTEFEHINTISPHKSLDANLEIINLNKKNLKPLIKRKKEIEKLFNEMEGLSSEPAEENLSAAVEIEQPTNVRIKAPDGKIWVIPSSGREEAVKRGAVPL